MENKKHNHTEMILKQPVIESKQVIGDFELLLTRDCPENFARLLQRQIETSGSAWFTDCPRDEHSTSRRKVCILDLSPENQIVVKQKAKVNDASDLKVEYFTQSIIHELRASYLLIDLMQKIDLPPTLVFQNETYDVKYEVQAPIAAVINLKQPSERYTIFKYVSGESVRNEVAMYDGWNNTPAEKRQLFGQFQQILNQIANKLINFGLEPWDLGVHQLVYTVDPKTKTIQLGILDAEEYNFSDRYGEHWPENFSKIGLPALLPFL